jgi:hypothetical protein
LDAGAQFKFKGAPSDKAPRLLLALQKQLVSWRVRHDMPRYYFHTYESRRTIIDDEGCDICDDTAARSEAIATVAEMARDG